MFTFDLIYVILYLWKVKVFLGDVILEIILDLAFQKYYVNVKKINSGKSEIT